MGPSKPLAWISLLITYFKWAITESITLKMGDCEILKLKTNSQLLELFPTSNEMGNFSNEIVTANSTALANKERIIEQ